MIDLTAAAAVERLVAYISRQLLEEDDAQPSSFRIQGRSHEHGRVRRFPRFAMSGASLPGMVTVLPDCPKPDHGRCTHSDGSWRPLPGVVRADSRASRVSLVKAKTTENEAWVDSHYELDRDRALWYCVRPFARAIERLRGENTRHSVVMGRLLAHDELLTAWEGFDLPKNPAGATLAFLRWIIRIADEEAHGEYEHRPKRWRSMPWTELSDAQRNAVIAGDEAS